MSINISYLKHFEPSALETVQKLIPNFRAVEVNCPCDWLEKIWPVKNLKKTAGMNTLYNATKVAG